MSDIADKGIIGTFTHRSAGAADVSEIGKSDMTTRNIAVTATVAAAAALVATGVTYASAAAPEAAPAVQQVAPMGGDSGQSKGNEG
ncbi:hypothetical protein ACWD7F_37630, partial [Streptomyces sp. NPDC005122]